MTLSGILLSFYFSLIPMSFVKDRSIYVSKRQAYDRNGGTPTFLGGAVYLQRTRTGVSNPHWRTQVKRQQNATTDMNGIFTTWESGRGVATNIVHGWETPLTYPVVNTLRWYGDIASFGAATPTWSVVITPSVATNRATIAFLKQVRQAQVQFSGPTALGEMRETLRMIRHPGQNLRKLADHWLHRVKGMKTNAILKNRTPYEWKKNLAGAWLEQAFGWQPLINDINGAYKTYKGLRDRKDQIPVRGYGIEERDYLPACHDATPYSPDSRVWMHASQKAREKCFVKYQGMVTCSTLGSTVDKLEPFGFTMSEFIPTAWELLPWSFLIDYFTNIGDVITAGVANRSSVAWVNRSTTTYQTVDRQVWYDKTYNRKFWGSVPEGPIFIDGSGPKLAHKHERKSVVRSGNSIVGTPTLSFEIPGLPAQWANMTALFAQANAIHPQRYKR